MPTAEQRAFGADSTLTSHDDPEGEDLAPGLGFAPGADAGGPEAWEIIRVNCPECRQPIALVGDEELLPPHAVLRTAWHPFSPALCSGSGLPADELDELAPEAEMDPDDAFSALLAGSAAHDWRTQPFSHVGGPASVPVSAPSVAQGGSWERVPPMRQAPRAQLVRH